MDKQAAAAFGIFGVNLTALPALKENSCDNFLLKQSYSPHFFFSREIFCERIGIISGGVTENEADTSGRAAATTQKWGNTMINLPHNSCKNVFPCPFAEQGHLIHYVILIFIGERERERNFLSRKKGSNLYK